ncbi:MAG: hypothetical protein QOD99_544, partial [Chthoniobacter sp.]|nr:hypothetical protein [Chthoniobacter sp.]
MLVFSLKAGAQTQQTTTAHETVSKPAPVVTETLEHTRVSVGKLSGVDPTLFTMSVSAEGSTSPISYTYNEQTKFFDNEGHATATLTYVQAGDKLLLMKAVVARPAV